MATSNNEWFQIYQNNLTGTSQPTTLQWSGHLTDATTVTTTTASSVCNQYGRVTRATNTGRKSSRSSRRTPTTLLNTDITNFRAMVQQFTGRGGSVSTAFMDPQPSTNFDYYGMGTRITPPAVGGYNVEVQQPPPQQLYRMAVDDGGDGSVRHPSFVVNFSGENNDGVKDNICMY